MAAQRLTDAKQSAIILKDQFIVNKTVDYQKVEELCEELGSTSGLYDEISQSYGSNEFESICEVLTDATIALAELMSVIASTTEDVQCRCLALEQDHAKLKADFESINAHLDKTKADLDRLRVGQIAFEIENEMIAQVLGESNVETYYSVDSYKKLMQALKQEYPFTTLFKHDKELLEAARARWTLLEQKIEWSEEKIRCFGYLKSQRKAVAHPPYDPAKMQQAIQELPARKKADALVLFDVLKKLKTPLV